MRARAPATEFDGGAIGNVVVPASPPRDGRNGWRVLALCGRGGTAEVWHAASSDGRQAALKRLRPDLRQRAHAQHRLRCEYALLRSIASPHLVTALEMLESDSGPELVLELLPNGDLVSLLGAPVRHWLPALRGVVRALTDLHGHGVAHGDVKARNVLFGADQRARLIDLTAVRAVDAPALRATPAYSLPPEIEATAGAADRFALGVLVYELTTARLPYGPEGAVHLHGIGPAEAPAEPAAARLLAAATAMMRAGGRLPQGLSYFADVIESVSAKSA